METYVKDNIRKSLKELIDSDPDFVKNLLEEVSNDLKQRKTQRIQEIIDEDFNEYDDVFRALA